MVVPAGQVMPVPAGVDLVTAAALPEVACTVWSNVFMVAGLQPDEVLLVHGGAGGHRELRDPARRPARGPGLHDRRHRREARVCRELGADVAIDYHDEDFVEVVREQTAGAGADVILDNMGAAYLGRNVSALATEGRLVVIGMQGGAKAELDLNALLRKRGAVVATALRARPAEEKAAICASVVEHVWPLVAEGGVRPIVHETVPLDDAPGPRADGVRPPHREDPADHGLRSVRLAAPGYRGRMTEQQETVRQDGERQVVIVGPDGQPIGSVPERRGRGRAGRRGRRGTSARSPTWSSSPPR